jgi:PAS domain S-box-containing protein
MDTGLRIIAWNRACEEITGIPREQAIGKTFTEVRPAAARFPAVMEGIENGARGYKSFASWESSAYATGYFEHHFIPLKADGAVIGVLIIIHDVAHRIKAEKELQSLNRALGQKNRELQRKTEDLTNFNWIASHDLKEPLRKIYTFIEMVATQEGQKISDNARSNLRRAQSAVQRMGLLTDDIVTFSQVTSPNEQLAPVSLQEALDAASKKHRKLIEDSSAAIDAPPLPVITAYPGLVGLLVQHLLGNALKFQPEGARPHVQISYALTRGRDIAFPEAESDARYHCLSIKDNGIGFAQEYEEKIFKMFQRLHPQGVYKGTGMGLSICRKVAEAHEGFITVQSVEGAGSTFSCYLKDFGGAG